jgi:hypothetical protein
MRGADLEQKNKMAKKWQWPWWVITPLILLWSGIMLFTVYRNVEAWQARNAIREMLDAPDIEFMVLANGRSVPSTGGVLGAIRGVHLQMAHHSHPDQEIPVMIRRDKTVLELTLARDSDDTQEYWVFWTREGRNPNRLEIGRIETSVFDSK